MTRYTLKAFIAGSLLFAFGVLVIFLFSAAVIVLPAVLLYELVDFVSDRMGYYLIVGRIPYLFVANCIVTAVVTIIMLVKNDKVQGLPKKTKRSWGPQSL